jgi:hypothetical protein
MSNFGSFGLVTDGLPGTAPQEFVASTPDSYATITAPGYMNDQSHRIKANDKLTINYNDTSVFPLNTGEAAILAVLFVQYDPTSGNYSLVPGVNNNTNVIASLGVHTARYVNAGGSATTTFADSNLTSQSIVIARWEASANAVSVETVAVGNDSLTVVSTGDPGASTLEYFAIIPSVALQNAGVVAAQYSYAGGGTTIVIANPLVTAASIVTANFASQANASKIAKVTAGNGTITIVCNANPGVSVISYMAVTASAALALDGLYAVQYTNAGGSATTSITDANILTTSIVVADWASQANAAYIEKVTVGSGSLTILSTGDPGASVLSYVATAAAESEEAGIFLVAANNLSDVQSAATSATNLGLGTGSSVVFTNLYLGASGTAGVLRVYPTTASTGYLGLTAASSAGNTATIITNADMGQAVTATIPDPGATTANFVLSKVGGFNQFGVTNITAGTTQTQAGATAITSGIALVTTGNAGDGIILPALSTALIGLRVQVINASAAAGVIYATGTTNTNTINGTAGATGVAYAASKTLFLVAVSATAWLSTLSN